MNWLNRLDDVLDSALRPRKPSQPEQPENESNTEAFSNETSAGAAEGNENALVGEETPSVAAANNNWHQGFVQNNHRVVSTANRSTNVPIGSNSSMSSQTSASSSLRGGGGALSRAPGRLKRIPVRRSDAPDTASPTTSDSERPPPSEKFSPLASLPSESSDSDVQKAEGQNSVEKDDLVESKAANEKSAQSENELPASGHNIEVLISLESKSASNETPIQSEKALESEVVQSAVDTEKSTPGVVKSNAQTENNKSSEKSKDLNSSETYLVSTSPPAEHSICTSAASPPATDSPDETDSEDAKLMPKSAAVTEQVNILSLRQEGQSIKSEKETAASLTGQSEVQTRSSVPSDSNPVPIDTEPYTMTSSVKNRPSVLQSSVESEPSSEPKSGSTNESRELGENHSVGNSNETKLCNTSDRESSHENINRMGSRRMPSPESTAHSGRETSSSEDAPKDLRSEAIKASTKRPSSAIPMSPVVEETSQVISQVEASQVMPCHGQTSKTFQPSQAKSVGAPSTKKSGLGAPNSSFEFEEVSVISDTQTFPHQVVFRSDFDVDHAPHGWEEFTTDGPPYDPRMNCFGVVHVRVLRAQRLPCPVGSSVQAIVSLPPWKGRIRTRKTRAFAGSRRRGVSTDWSDGETAISMVHAYSSEESPIPSIKIEIVFSTLGLFEFKMCSLTLPCEMLLRQPMFPRRQWFQTVPDSKETAENIPLLQVEAMFEPEEKTVSSLLSAPMEVVEVRRRSSTDDASMLESTSSALASVTASTIQTRLPPSRQPSLSDRSLQPVLETGSSNEEKEGKIVIVKKSSQQTTQQQEEATTSGGKSDLSVSLASYRKMTSTVSTKGHLLRTKTFYTPAWCSVCGGNIMSGIWKVLSFHCEQCGIDCCSDCRLQVDVQLPCGSEEARKAAEEAAEAQFTTDKLLNWVAPIEESINQLTHGSLESKSDSPNARLSDDEPGIGKIKFSFVQAFVLQNPLPADADVDIEPPVMNLKRGDYYIRVGRSDTMKTSRTRTVQRTTRPQFDSSEIVVSVPHYASEFRVELVDAADDNPIGFVYMTAQMLLQEQRDDAVKQSSLPLPSLSFRKRRIVRELRKFVKSGAASEYFVGAGTKGSGEVLGIIVGMIEFQVVLEEDFRALYGGSPYMCPPRPKDELDLAKFKAHIGRISQLVSDVRSTIHMIGYVVSWENPYLTATSLLVFVRFCYQVHPDHFFTGPVLLCILYMAYLAFLRTNDGLKHRYLEKDLMAHRKSSAAPEYLALHRPVGLLKTIVGGGKNIRSPEMGLPGNVSCRVSVDLARYCDENDRKLLSAIDAAVGPPHIVGSTEQVYSTSPKWKFLEETVETKRLKKVIPSKGGFFDNSELKENVSELDFPILQPISRNSKTEGLELRPWSDSKAALVFEVVFHDFAAILPGSEYSLGEVAVPVSEIVEHGELSGWYKISHNPSSEFFALSGNHNEEEIPAISVGMRWVPPAKVEGLPADVEREASIVMQEELSRAVKLAQKKNVGLVGSSLGAINTVRGISGYILAIQNGLGSLLDIIETARSLVNFSDPLKSSFIVVLLVFLWFILYVIPLRLLVFTIGMIPYSVSLKARYDKQFPKEKKPTDSPSKDGKNGKKVSPFAIWVNNFTRSLPIDDDLRKTYFWETRRAVAKKLRGEADERRTSRLRKLWRAQWYEAVEVLQPGDKGTPVLRASFAVILGRRFMWWASVDDFDNADQPIGKIFLQGHAGLATPSPIELKAIGENSSRAVSIFGKGAKDQERITLLVSGEQSKERFENAVVSALHTKDD